MSGAPYIKRKWQTVYSLLYFRVYLGFLKLVSKIRYSLSPAKNFDFIIIDDLVPSVSGGFRNSEFSFLLNNIKGSALFSTIATRISPVKHFDFFFIKSAGQFNKYKREFCNACSIDEKRIQPFYPHTKINARLAYIVFLSNALYLIDYLEERNINFILELYPGGGFNVSETPANLNQLKRVLGSRNLEKVIVTQNISRNFLLQHDLCPPGKIAFMYGGILSPQLFGLPAKTIKYGIDKDTIDICFTSAKYMPAGYDKGYDIFIDMAHMLLACSNKFRFHIVGGFNEADIPIKSEYASYFTFYGYLKADDFREYYKDKDIFICPCRPFTLGPGAFDGFPTTTCAEAGLNGVCMILSDPLHSNVIFEKGKDALFPENDAMQFYENVIHLFQRPADIYTIGENGKIALHKMHCDDQLEFRLSLINNALRND